MIKKDLEKSKSKRDNALVILKLWEEKLKIENEVNSEKEYLKVKNDSNYTKY